jgi:hypothetical protein
MKKLIISLVLLTLLGCVRDEVLMVEPIQEVPEALTIDELVGIKLENNIVTERVAMNVKLPEDGVYRIKIRHSMTNDLISQERITGTEGDNILKVYVYTLDKSGYKLELTSESHTVIGRTSFTVN